MAGAGYLKLYIHGAKSMTRKRARTFFFLPILLLTQSEKGTLLCEGAVRYRSWCEHWLWMSWLAGTDVNIINKSGKTVLTRAAEVNFTVWRSSLLRELMWTRRVNAMESGALQSLNYYGRSCWLSQRTPTAHCRWSWCEHKEQCRI